MARRSQGRVAVCTFQGPAVTSPNKAHAHHVAACRKLDANDFKHIVNNGLGVLSQGVPSVGGFLGGFLLAIKQF